MTALTTLTLEVDPRGVATLTLNRPDKHNALDAAMIRELRAVIARLNADPTLRALVLTGTGKTFCGGGDLRWMQDQMAADRTGRVAEATEIASMLRELDALRVPVIARVQGPAYGGGVGLLCVCDVVVAVASATFVLSETKLGLIPATIGPYVVRRLGEGAARQVFFNSKPFPASRARDFGLVSRVVEAAELDTAVNEEVAAVLACAPGAVADAKALCKHLARSPGIDMLGTSVNRLADRWETDEARAGLDAFFARRLPPWQTK